MPSSTSLGSRRRLGCTGPGQLRALLLSFQLAGAGSGTGKPGSGKLRRADPETARRDYLRTRNRRMVTVPDRVVLTGSRSIRGRPGGEKRMPSPSSTGSTYTRIDRKSVV